MQLKPEMILSIPQRIFIGVTIFLWAMFHTHVSIAQAERILSYHVDLKLSSENELLVTEQIKVVANGINIKRGIFRVLPENRSKSNPLKDMSYEVVAITQNSKESPYHTKSENDNKVIYIGEEDTQLEPGIYEYEIKYKTANAVGFFDNFDELYWNVTGTDWSFAIDSVSATVHLPDTARIIQQSCYTGYAGSGNSDCTSKQLSDNEMMWNASGLNPNEGLTIAVGFNKNVIKPPAPPGYWQKKGLLFFAGAIVLLLLIYYIFTWLKYGRDPQAPTVYPLFESPNNISPAILGYVNNQYYKQELVTASIVNLAVKGYLKINETRDSILFGLIDKTKYSLTRLKKSDTSLPLEEKALLEKLFEESDELNLTGSYQPQIGKAVTSYSSSIKSAYGRFISKGNNRKLLILPTLVLVAAILIVAFFDATIVDRSVPLFVFAFVGIGVLFTLSFILGFLSARYKVLMGLIASLEIGILLYLTYHVLQGRENYLQNNQLALAILLLFGAASIMFYIYFIRKPSPEKLKLQAEIKGFGMYLGAAEEAQMQFFNSPKMTPEIFEKFLPYAMVLGVEKIWGEKFSNRMKESAIDSSTQYHSSWYSGTNLSPSAFSSALGSSFSQSITAASTAPSSSGSSGGGSSGGGGGGGGGGGW